jgi:hypothetical protein
VQSRRKSGASRVSLIHFSPKTQIFHKSPSIRSIASVNGRDRKKKKYVTAGGDKRVVRAEDGSRVAASFKSNRYTDWAARHHMDKFVWACVVCELVDVSNC